MGTIGIKDEKLLEAMEKLPETVQRLWPDEKDPHRRQMLEALESLSPRGRVIPGRSVPRMTDEQLKERLPRLLLIGVPPESDMPSHQREKPANDITKKRKKDED